MNLSLAIAHINPSTVLDIGANIGGWYLEAKQCWPNATFFLVEANDECRTALEQLGAPFEIAVLSNTEKEVDFFTMKDCGTATGCSYYRENTPFFEGDKAVPHRVKTTTLDRLVDSKGIIKSGKLLIKLDCQGAELDILKGGPLTVNSADAIIIEIAHTNYNEGAPLAHEVLAYLTGLGFTERAKLEDVCHPLNREQIIQTTILLTR
jgi:FkbM family methyltransferase